MSSKLLPYYGTHRPPPSVPRTDFGPPPPGYVPGVGRGAVGFTTRSDIGPARPMQEEQVIGRSRVLPVPPLPAGYGAKQSIPTVALKPSALGGTSSSTTTAPASSTSSSSTTSSNSVEAEQAKEDAAEAVIYSEQNFDQFEGYSEHLFSTGEYEEDDKEADSIYGAIDRRMDTRRKKRRIERANAEEEDEKDKKLNAAAHFFDMKRNLKTISEEEWEAIPEPLDYSRRNQLLKQANLREKFTPLPDSILASVAGKVLTGTASIGSSDKHAAVFAGMDSSIGTNTTIGTATPAPDLTSIGRARDKMLGLQLDRMADSVSGQTVIDPKGYLTSLSSFRVNSSSEVSDIKKARVLLKSVIQTNPSHAPGWIAYARLEKETGQLTNARTLILKGCEACPNDEDIWVEAALLHHGKEARSILARALQDHIPNSIQLWLLAATLEETVQAKQAILRRALEILPTSVKLWKAAIALENEEDARILLKRAVELVPESVELWLTYAKLSEYKEARKILNEARKANPRDSSIWITAAQLEEANGTNLANNSIKSEDKEKQMNETKEKVTDIIKKAVSSLKGHEVRFDRDAWLNEAKVCEQSNFPLTCTAIVSTCVGIDVEELDQKNTWLNDADRFYQEKAYVTTRAIYRHLLQHFDKKESIWLKVAAFERQHGTKQDLITILKLGVEKVPQSSLLWLMYAKECLVSENVAAARDIIRKALDYNVDNEELWLAAMKIEYDQKEYQRARRILEMAREKAPTARLYMKSAKLERLIQFKTKGNSETEAKIIEEGLALDHSYWKLWLMKAQWCEREGKWNEARNVYGKATKEASQIAIVWIRAAQFEIEYAKQIIQTQTTPKAITALGMLPPLLPSSSKLLSTAISKARSILENARRLLPKNDQIWLAAIRIEQMDTTSTSSASQYLARALQECPTSGLLWSHAILTDPRPKRKQRTKDALDRCQDDALVFLSVARLFWCERKVNKSRNWFERAIAANSDIGDIWCYYYRFELSYAESGSAERINDLIKRCSTADPSHGELWTSVSKKDEFSHLKAEEIMKEGAMKINEILPGERILSLKDGVREEKVETTEVNGGIVVKQELAKENSTSETDKPHSSNEVSIVKMEETI